MSATIELELSDEEKAQLLTSLAVGLSDSTVTRETSIKSVVQKKEHKKFVGPPVPVNRDGMGRYIPKPGERPLCVLDEPTPGPGGYLPDYSYVHKKYPEYSMGEGVAERRKKRGTPAPNKYDTRGNIAWGRCKTISIKKKLPSKSRFLGPGPAAHSAAKSSLGGPNARIVSRPRARTMHGFVSSLAERPDPTVPGPSYKPCDDEWLQKPKTFGAKPPLPRVSACTPGPCAYQTKVEQTGPKWKICDRPRSPEGSVGPGPAFYWVKPLVPRRRGVSMGRRHPAIKEKYPTPGPDQYKKDRKRLDDPGYTLQYRWFDTAPEITPGPGHYAGEKDPTLRRPPAFTFRHHWAHLDRDAKVPGPGRYNIAAPPLNKGRTIGLRLQADKEHTPCPTMYNSDDAARKTLKKTPAYSLTGRAKEPSDEECVPGPASYDIEQKSSCKPARSFGIRLQRTVTSDGPGPAAKSVREATHREVCGKCECRKAASMKGRHTPCKYSGFWNMSRVEPPIRDVPVPPLLG